MPARVADARSARPRRSRRGSRCAPSASHAHDRRPCTAHARSCRPRRTCPHGGRDRHPHWCRRRRDRRACSRSSRSRAMCWPGLVLRLARTRKRDPDLPVAVLREAGAVEAADGDDPPQTYGTPRYLSATRHDLRVARCRARKDPLAARSPADVVDLAARPQAPPGAHARRPAGADAPPPLR